MSDIDESDTGGIANLRKQYDETAKALKAAQDELASFRAERRTVTVAEILKAKGLPEKVASLYTGEDTSEDAVGKWAEQYADVFGGTPATQQNDDNANAAARISAASHGETLTPVTRNNDGQVLGDPAELLRIMNDRSIPYADLQKMGLQPQLEGTLYNPKRR